MKKAQRLVSMVLIMLTVLLSPIQAMAYEAYEGGQKEPLAETTIDNSTENNEDSTADINANDSVLLEDAEKSIEIPYANETAEVNTAQVIDYTYVENLTIAKGETENIVVSLLNKATKVEGATLQYTTPNSETVSVEMSEYTDGILLFNPDTSGEFGEYKIMAVTYVSEGVAYTIDAHQEGIEAAFCIVTKEEKSQAEFEEDQKPDIDTKVQVMGTDGAIKEVSTIEEGLEIAEEQQGKTIQTSAQPSATKGMRASGTGNIVVVLDPGHDNQHAGAASSINGINEEVYTLQIAKACRAELQQYNGVDVYMTVEENGDTRWPGTTFSQCLTKRVEFAKSKGADLFVSMHLNSAGSAAYGAEVFVSNYSRYNGEGTELANRVLKELGKLGISSRGVKTDIDYQQSQGNKYDDGNWVDDLSVIRNSTYSGFPSVLIEHGFITNSGDASIIKSRTNELGQADARAIAEHLNLMKRPFGVSPSKSAALGNKVTLTAYPTNIPSGYNQYRFIYFNGQEWKRFNDFSTDTTYEWTPKELGGSFILGMEAKNEAGDVQQYIIWQYFSVEEPEISITGISVTEKQEGMVIHMTPIVQTNSDALKYRYQVYDLDRQVWTTVKNDTKEKGADWSPKKGGSYWLHVVAVSPSGKEYPYTMGYGVPSGRAYIESFSADVSSASIGQKVNLSAKYKVLSEEKNTHQFLVYNGQYWADITGESKEAVTWIPQSYGNYLLCYQITTSTGAVFQKFVGLDVAKPETTLYGINAGQLNSRGEVSLSANVKTTDSELKYTYKAYDMNKWASISVESTEGNTIWIPKKSGTYLLYLEVIDSSGQSYTYAMGYNVPSLVKIEGFKADKSSPQGVGSKISLSGKVSIPETINATYEYMYYNGITWYSIDKSDVLHDAVWQPEQGGTYLLCFQVTTEAGEVYQNFMGYDITEPKVEIQGIEVGSPDEAGEIRLKAQVNTNDDGIKYTFKYYDMKNWHMISFKEMETITKWRPGKAGTYLLYLEAESSTGKTYTYSMGTEIKDEARITGIKINPESPQIKGSRILLKGEFSAIFSEDFTYEYLIYDGKNWSTLSSDKKVKEVEWTPQKQGAYVICFQVITDKGQVHQWFTSYEISAPYVKINGISVGKIDKNKQINLKANISTNDHDLKYTFQAYDMKQWKNIVVETKDSSAKWTVDKEGIYLLYLEIRGSDGNIYTYSMGVTVQNEVNIAGFKTDLKSPQKLMDNLSISLNGAVNASYMQGLIFRYMYYDGKSWNLISETKDSPSKAIWNPKKVYNYLLCFQVETESGRQINSFIGYVIDTYYYIMGESSVSVQQMVDYFNNNNQSYDKFTKISGYDGVLSRGGASTIRDYCQMFYEEAHDEGVKVEVAFCQAMLETGFLKFGGDVKPDQYNFAGLGATGGGNPGNRFSTVREGIRAQIQHLKCYASTAPLNKPCVDQRWGEWLRGTATTVEALSQKWAVGADYGQQILDSISRLYSY